MDSIVGIVFGLSAAFFQALSYVFSGLSVRRYDNLGTVGILARSMLVVGGIAVVMLPFTWVPEMNGQMSRYLPFAVADILAFFMGQASLFMAQRTIDASTAVPFLGIKLAFLAIINTWIIRNASYSWVQWLAVGLTIMSAFLLSKNSKKITLSGFLWLCLACASYACSDTYITKLTHRVAEIGVQGDLRCAMIAAFLSYIVAGIFSIGMMPFVKKAKDNKVWFYTSCFGFLWMSAMVCLYCSMAKIGTVSGGIAQSTRGIMVVVLSVILVKFGMTELEEKTSRKVFYKRMAAAILMVASIILFNAQF